MRTNLLVSAAMSMSMACGIPEPELVATDEGSSSTEQAVSTQSCGEAGGDYCSQTGSCPGGYSSLGATYDCSPCCKSGSTGTGTPALKTCGALGGNLCSGTASCPLGYSSRGVSSDCKQCCLGTPLPVINSFKTPDTTVLVGGSIYFSWSASAEGCSASLTPAIWAGPGAQAWSGNVPTSGTNRFVGSAITETTYTAKLVCWRGLHNTQKSLTFRTYHLTN